MKSIVAVLLLLSAGVAQAQTYPTKPVRMVIHIGPGSSMDIVGRVLAQKLNETWGQPVIVHDMDKWRRVVKAAGVSAD